MTLINLLRKNIFRFFVKVSPVIEAISVLAIAFLLFYYESQQKERQIAFEQNLIFAQVEVKKQQAVRDYLSEINTIYLELKLGNQNKLVRQQIEEDKEIKKLLEVTTLAIFDELSIGEGFQGELDDSKELKEKFLKRDRKGDVINFLSQLGWINRKDSENAPLLSLSRSNLSQADLRVADLKFADLSFADLSETDLRFADLSGADLNSADLSGADLSGAKLGSANLSSASLFKADLRFADLSEAKLKGSILCQTIMPNGAINNEDCEDSIN